MHRRKPGRRMHRMRLPVATAALAVSVLASCSSDGGSGSTSTPPTRANGSSTASSSAPPSISPPPAQAVARPTGSPTAVNRHLTRPAGAKAVDFKTCSAPGGVVQFFMEHVLFSTSDRAQQLQLVPQVAEGARDDAAAATKSRRTFLADGYGENFPVVRDLDALLAFYPKMIKASNAGNLDAMPALYTELSRLLAQYGQDTAARSICPV